VLILLGAPGAGKGTQAREIAKYFAIPHISTGDILREAVQKRTPLGLAAQAKMQAGELVPDDVVCKIIEERISKPDCGKGFILDGFPRTIPQAEFLDRLLLSSGRGNPCVINLRVDRDVLMKRLTGRRVCPAGGEIYNIYYNPPKVPGTCDVDGSKLIQRADDNEETIVQRLEAYDKETSPLIKYYTAKNVLHDVDGNKDPQTTARELRALLEKLE
jgi:adenylate kinase